MRIAVVGAGGLGAYFGGRWTAAGLDVTLLARGAQLAALSANPLRIASPLGDATVPVRVADRAEQIGPVDVVVVATKTWQLADAAAQLAPLFGPDSVVIGVQNGVEAGDVLAAAVGEERVLDGTCRIISYVDEPGSVTHLGVPPILTFGERRGGFSERANAVQDCLVQGDGLTVRVSSNIAFDLWKKFLFFAPFSAIGAAVQRPVGAWREIPPTRRLLVDGMREIVALAPHRGVTLPKALLGANLEFVDQLPANGTTSLLRDVRDGRRTELEALAGAVSRLGREYGVPTPVHDHLYALLLPHELAAQRAASSPQS